MNEDKNMNSGENQETDEVIFVDESEDTNPKAIISKLREKLKACEKERIEYLDGWQRSKADYINAKKVLASEKSELINFAEVNLIEELLPTLDSFFAARQNKEAWESTPKDWRIGVEYIEQQLKNVLLNKGLEIVIPEGEKFNHEFHEAISEEDGEKGIIIRVIQPGYKLKDKILRVARVIVGK